VCVFVYIHIHIYRISVCKGPADQGGEYASSRDHHSVRHRKLILGGREIENFVLCK